MAGLCSRDFFPPQGRPTSAGSSRYFISCLFSHFTTTPQVHIILYQNVCPRYVLQLFNLPQLASSTIMRPTKTTLRGRLTKRPRRLGQEQLSEEEIRV
jgi:hypothetical protein